jgi:mercuric ion transport protein
MKLLERASTRRVSIAGAIVAALAASSCCIGPLILAVLGVGGAGAFTFLAGYRSPMLLGAAALLGLGFYLTYRTPRSDACGCEKPNAKRGARTALWLGATFTVLLAAAPSLLSKAFAHTDTNNRDDRATQQAVISVQGIDCEACAAPLRRALSKEGGFHALALNIPEQKIAVTYEPAPGRLEAYVAAIHGLGYEASLMEEKQ